MNLSMTGMTEYSQVLYFIVLVTLVYVVNMKSFRSSAYKAFRLIKGESLFPIATRSNSIIRVIFSIKPNTFSSTFNTTIIRALKLFVGKGVSLLTAFTFFCSYRTPLTNRPLPTRTTTKVNCTRLLFTDVSWSRGKGLLTEFTCKIYQFVTGTFVARFGAKLSSIFFELLLTCRAYFHAPIISLAVAKQQQPLRG